MSDRKRAKQPPPAKDDPRYERTCTRCGVKRQWSVCICPACKNPEFTVPLAALEDECEAGE
jgi:lipopolysaccharide biosynthesis regulator YciM